MMYGKQSYIFRHEQHWSVWNSYLEINQDLFLYLGLIYLAGNYSSPVHIPESFFEPIVVKPILKDIRGMYLEAKISFVLPLLSFKCNKYHFDIESNHLKLLVGKRYRLYLSLLCLVSFSVYGYFVVKYVLLVTKESLIVLCIYWQLRKQ